VPEEARALAYVEALLGREGEGGRAWVLKASESSNGARVHPFRTAADAREPLADLCAQGRPWLVQRYVDRPLLVGGCKTHCRAYVLVLGRGDPGTDVYVFDHVPTFISSVAWSMDDLGDAFAHLTNHSVQTNHPAYDDTTHRQVTLLRPPAVRWSTRWVSARTVTQALPSLAAHLLGQGMLGTVEERAANAAGRCAVAAEVARLAEPADGAAAEWRQAWLEAQLHRKLSAVVLEIFQRLRAAAMAGGRVAFDQYFATEQSFELFGLDAMFDQDLVCWLLGPPRPASFTRTRDTTAPGVPPVAPSAGAGRRGELDARVGDAAGRHARAAA
jgi:hypothetical protein